MSYGYRKQFYHSKVWNQVRKNIWLKQNLLCNRCGLPVYVDGISDYIPKENRRIGIVHHKIYLDNINVYDDNIALDEDNLEGICITCHNKEHFKTNGIRNNYLFDDDGNIKKA